MLQDDADVCLLSGALSSDEDGVLASLPGVGVVGVPQTHGQHLLTNQLASPMHTEAVTLDDRRASKRRRKESPASEASGSSSMGSSSQERWVQSLESCNLALTTSVDALTRAHAVTSANEKMLSQENLRLKAQITAMEGKLHNLELQCCSEREISHKLRADLQSASGDASFAENSVVGELKESLKTVTQLLLSRGQLDSATAQLLRVLTAPIGGLEAIGSRTGIIGLEHAHGEGGNKTFSVPPQSADIAGGTMATTSRNTSVLLTAATDKAGSVTPLSLMGAAVSGPVVEAPPSQAAAFSEIMQPGDPLFGKNVFKGFDFNFTPKGRTPASRLFGVVVGVGVTFCVASDRVALHGHVPQNRDDGVHVVHHASRRLLQVVSSANEVVPSSPLLSLVYHGVIYAVLFLGVCCVTVVLWNLLGAGVAAGVQCCRALPLRRGEQNDPILPSKKVEKQCNKRRS